MPCEIRVPRLGWSMEEGVFVGWLKQPGQEVKVGDPLFEIEGDKALQVVESIDAGTLHVSPHAPPPGSTVAVGVLLGYLLAPGEPVPAIPPAPTNNPAPAATSASSPAAPSAGSPQAAAPRARLPLASGPAARRLARQLGIDLGTVTSSVTSAPAQPTLLAAPATGQASQRVISSPRARRVAAELGVDWTGLAGTGRAGRVRERDVRAAQPATSPRAVPLSPRRRAIAQRLRQSYSRVVPVTLTTIADATSLVALRERFKSPPTDVLPTYTDLLACLVAQVLQHHPRMAVRWDGAEALLPVAVDDYHIGIAVDTPQGLLTPVVRAVTGKPPAAVAHESRRLIERARSGRLSATDAGSAVITLSNLGAFGIDAFTPIINYPEIAILGLGAIRREAIVLDDQRRNLGDQELGTEDLRFVSALRMTLSLTFDHAAIDGAPAAEFLRDVALAVSHATQRLASG